MFGRMKKRFHDRQQDRHGSSSSFGPPSSASLGASFANKARLGGQQDSAALSKAMDLQLASFHACVEAADALAAASGHQESLNRSTGSNMAQSPQPPGGAHSTSAAAAGLTDCSVLVSPDGDLLLIPDNFYTKHNNNDDNHRSSLFQQTRRSLNSAQTTNSNNTDETSLKTNTTTQTLLSELMANGKDDYESAVFLGNDILGDYALNGFSARGWSVPATSAALEQTQHSLRDVVAFCEDFILTKKEFAAKVSVACDTLRMKHPSLGGTAPHVTVRKNSASEGGMDPSNGDFGMTLQRVGPLLRQGSSLTNAMVALEEYYATMAEWESQRWRMASLQRKSVLPAIREATKLFDERVQRRQYALDCASQKVKVMESRLELLKRKSEQQWEAVYQAEDLVTQKVEELMQVRSRARERERMGQLRVQEEKRVADSSNGPTMSPTSEELWNIVSEVAESMEDGTFEPMDLPAAPLEVPRDQSVDADDSTDVSVTSSNADNGSIRTIPMASREQIELDVRLPDLRALAMATDDAMADAADALMNMLSNLDTTQRSARVAAETCLVSAMNAQSVCIRSLVKLERASLEERLRELVELEQVADSIAVRKDLDAYIQSDKQDRGGLSHLGDDDDGGIASALAILSRHVEGSMGSDSLSRLSTENVERLSECEVSASDKKLDEALDSIFTSDEHLTSNNSVSLDDNEKARETFERGVAFLCEAASEVGSSARAKRSRMCYALNAKRGSNAEIKSLIQFDALCRVFNSILTGCCSEEGGVSNAKMCIMLTQTFYFCKEEPTPSTDGPGDDSASSDRGYRDYVKNYLKDHPLWAKDDFWDHAFSLQLAESLTHSGVMSNFESTARPPSKGFDLKKSEWTQTKKTKWYDLTPWQRVDAAAQVHAVVFAQLGALSHSMIELGQGLQRSVAFVRRMAIRNQLPSSQRSMLLEHLMQRDGVERRELEIEVKQIQKDASVSVDESDGSVDNDDIGLNARFV
jgi:hypothetical protein